MAKGTPAQSQTNTSGTTTGGGTSQTTSQLTPEQQQLINAAMPGLMSYAQQTGAGLARGAPSTVAGFDPVQQEAQGAVLNAARGNIQNLAQSGYDANQLLTSGQLLRPESNPALRAYMDTAVRPLQRNLTETVLPQIAGGAVQAGGLGGSRQGIAEGLAAGRTQDAIGDVTSKLAMGGYQSGLDAYMKGLGLLPQTQGLQLAAPGAIANVGDVRQGATREGLQDASQRYWLEQMFPLLQGQNLAQMVGALPGGGATTSTTGQTTTMGTGAGQQIAGKNPVTGGLGGALSGASMGSMFGPPGMLIGALGGGALGAFG